MKYYQGKIEQDIHKRMKAEAAKQGVSIVDYINGLIMADLRKRGALHDMEPKREKVHQ